MKLVPKRRFKEFQNADAWEQREVGEVVQRVCVGFVGTLEKYYTDSTGIPLYRTGNLNGLKLNTKDLKYVTKQFHLNNAKSQLKYGDILIARHGENGKAVIYESYKEANCLNIVIIRPNIDTSNSIFLANCINSPVPNQQIKNLSAGSTQVVINTKEIEKLTLYFPLKKEEQEKIGSFFKQLDETIALHQRKLEKIKAMKSAYLAEMFPAEGERVPKRRFKKYVNEWQTMNFEQILVVNSGKDYKHLNKGSIPVYGTGGFMLLVNDKLSDVDAIGIGRKGTIDRPQLLKAPFWTVDTLFFLTPIKNMNLYFLYIKSQTINWREMDESTGVPSLSKTTIEKISVSIPCLNEQQAIGGFFKKLDDSIANQQQKLNKLKATKQAYLEEMFV